MLHLNVVVTKLFLRMLCIISIYQMIYCEASVQIKDHRSGKLFKCVNTTSDYLKSSARAQIERLWFRVCAEVTQSVVSGFWAKVLMTHLEKRKHCLLIGLLLHAQAAQVTVEIFAQSRDYITSEQCVRCCLTWHCLVLKNLSKHKLGPNTLVNIYKLKNTR